MQCKSCGATVDPDSKFCKLCGAKIETVAEPEPASAPDEFVRMGEMVYSAYKHRDSGNFDAAIDACRAALAVNPASSQVTMLLGSIYELQGDTASALSAYQRAAELDPNDAEARSRIARLTASGAGLKERLSAKLAPTLEYLSSTREKWVPFALAGVAAIVVMSLLMLLVNGAKTVGNSRASRAERASSDSSPVSQPAPGAQPYVGRQVPQQQAYPSQQDVENDAQVGQTPQQQAQAQRYQAVQPRTGVPPVSVPSTAQQNRYGRTRQRPSGPIQPLQPISPIQPVQPTQPQGGAVVPNGEPAITPVIEPSQSGAPQASTHRMSNATPSRSDAIRPSDDPVSRGMQYQNANRYQDAVGQYEKSLSKTKDKAGVYQQMGLSYQRSGQNSRAIDCYRKAIQSYQQQLSSGRDKAEVAAGIRSCEAGIQICSSR